MDLNKMLNELKEHEPKSRSEMLTKFIQIRLTEAVNSYYNELDKSLNYLAYRDSLRVLSKINKENK